MQGFQFLTISPDKCRSALANLESGIIVSNLSKDFLTNHQQSSGEFRRGFITGLANFAFRRPQMRPLKLIVIRGAPDLEFSNPVGTGFAGFGQKFQPKFRPDLKQDILG